MPASRERQKSGFTLIELIAVMVIISILAIVSLPKFTNLQSGAYQASVEATAGAFRSALLLANLICMAKSGAGANNLPGFGDGDVDFNARCFPAADSAPNGNGNGNNGNGNGNGGGNGSNGNGNGNGNNGNGNGGGNGSNGNGNGNGNNGNGNGNGGGNGTGTALSAEACVNIWYGILSMAPSVSPDAGSDYRASASGATCLYTLELDRNVTRSFSYDSLTGTVTVVSNP